jgi:hypothetical protein
MAGTNTPPRMKARDAPARLALRKDVNTAVALLMLGDITLVCHAPAEVNGT